MTDNLLIDRHGDGPAAVLIHVPHAGTHIPPEVRADLLLDDQGLTAELDAMTDWHTDRLAAAAAALAAADGCAAVVATNPLSRLVIDPERFPDDTEVMNQVGMGAVYQRTSRGRPLRHSDPARDRALLETYFHPYAEALAALVDELLVESGRCLIIDLHSYPSVALPYELDQAAARPSVCLGTDPFHTPAELTATARAAFGDGAGTIGENTPFAGTYVPLRHYRRDHRVASLMVELRRDTYLTEPNSYDERRAADLARRIARLVALCPIHQRIR